MTYLYGKQHSKLDLARRSGSLQQFAGVQQHTISNGLGRGVRVLRFRTGTGFQFEVLVDRAMDIGTVDYRGAAVGWHSPTQFRHPALHEYNDEGGLSWLRSLSGLVQTCGLDHTLFMDSRPAENYVYEHRTTVDSSLHGRIANIPAHLDGYGESWEGDQCTLWCEGTVIQAAVFGEDLHLIRRIEAVVGSNEFVIKDRVENHGFLKTPHMFLYHINIGYPVLDQGSEFIAPIKHTIWASHEQSLEQQGVGYRTMPAPQTTFHEQVFEHAMACDSNHKIPVVLANRNFDNGKGIGLQVEFNKDQFPYMFEWQNLQEGLYALAFEPSSNHVLGRPFAEQRGELRWLEHGQSHAYETRFTVLDGQAAIDQAAQRISSICEQPEQEYPAISGNWDD